MAPIGGKFSTVSGMFPKSRAVPETAKDLQRLQAVEKRRIKKIMKNRRSAHRSWMRKQQKADDLKALVNRLGEENKQLRTHLSKIHQSYFKQATENSALRLSSPSCSYSSYGFYKTKPSVNFADSDQIIDDYYK